MMKKKVVLNGKGNNLGILQGKVTVFTSSNSELPSGGIMVIRSSKVVYFSELMKAKGVIADTGGLLSHLAIHSLELGIPGVFGTNTGTKTLQDGDIVEIDSFSGQIFLIQ